MLMVYIVHFNSHSYEVSPQRDFLYRPDLHSNTSPSYLLCYLLAYYEIAGGREKRQSRLEFPVNISQNGFIHKNNVTRLYPRV
ncbi:hypothetical protein Y032_0062g3347 [Ancylostoma ceylanicum]|uniref:Uncharacterized protein n=2 Tax=Ancylostoma ceylanicum TaxID=53326 RepID=A0A016U2B1_9BILA|nr:hypothetical protein Y032_0062g3347 [Ancylostoma ceylanicum]